MTLQDVLTELRPANIARQAEWQGGVDTPLAFRIMELGGEVGEALNIAKKLARERLGLVGSRATVADLASELADVVICADLVGLSLSIPATPDIVPGSVWPNPAEAARALMIGAGAVAEDKPRVGLVLVLQAAAELAANHGADLAAAVVAKFNATSDKHHWATYIGRPPSSAGMIAIKAERRRQIAEEGWTAAHDDAYRGGELLSAAEAYADEPGAKGGPPGSWPWLPLWWKPGSKVSDLTKAGALCLAELDRMARRYPRAAASHPHIAGARLLLAKVEAQLTELLTSIPCPYCGAPCDMDAIGPHDEFCRGYGPHADIGPDEPPGVEA